MLEVSGWLFLICTHIATNQQGILLVVTSLCNLYLYTHKPSIEQNQSKHSQRPRSCCSYCLSPFNFSILLIHTQFSLFPPFLFTLFLAPCFSKLLLDFYVYYSFIAYSLTFLANPLLVNLSWTHSLYMLWTKHGRVESMDCAAQSMDPHFVR